MTLSVKTRFEVFKRDRFTCAYCGRTPPEVLLEADHVVPKAVDGSDEIHNLITSCQSCNRGKGARLLDEGTTPVIGKANTEELQERLDQARAYMEAVTSYQAYVSDQTQMVTDAWAAAYGANIEAREDGSYWVMPDGGSFLDIRSIRTILKRLPLHDVLDAVDVAAGRMNYPNDGACRYFYGVCWGRIRAREGTETA